MAPGSYLAIKSDCKTLSRTQRKDFAIAFFVGRVMEEREINAPRRHKIIYLSAFARALILLYHSLNEERDCNPITLERGLKMSMNETFVVGWIVVAYASLCFLATWLEDLWEAHKIWRMVSKSMKEGLK